MGIMKPIASEGHVTVLGYGLFYKSVGEPVKGTVLGPHGRPGTTHDYLLPLADLAPFGYRVVFYDQPGCGKSELPKNITLFTVERAVEEAIGMRKALALGRGKFMRVVRDFLDEVNDRA